MDRRDPPPTREGWYALHDFRAVDWDAWREAPRREREQAIEEGRRYLEAVESLEDAEEGASVTYAITGHKADLMVVHLRPTMADLNALERRFEHTALAGITNRTNSYVSVTEASGYTNDELDPDQLDDTGLANYIRTRLYPTIPDAEYVCFYPMDKRREPGQNWYDLSFEERAEHMQSHGEIGRGYAGDVTQMITGSIGLDDFEWGVTLWSDDPTRFKDLLYEMRFDPSTSQFAEFGPFFTGQRLKPTQLESFLAGESLDGDVETEGGSSEESPAPPGDHGSGDAAGDVRAELEDLGVYAGQPHGEDVHALVVYSEADPATLFEEMQGLRANFDHYDTHVKTAVYEDETGDGERTAVVSIWETERAAQTAGGFLSELPEVVGRAGEASGFGTMGMFYQIQPAHREDFLETFEEVEGLLADMDGHLDTRLMVNREDEHDTFIASQWEAREDAMAFFRSEAFSETVEWGREVLADRPRHVFLA